MVSQIGKRWTAPPRQNQTFGTMLTNSLNGNIVPYDLAVNILFTDATSDQLSILGAKIQDQNTFIGEARMYCRCRSRWHSHDGPSFDQAVSAQDYIVLDLGNPKV